MRSEHATDSRSPRQLRYSLRSRVTLAVLVIATFVQSVIAVVAYMLASEITQTWEQALLVSLVVGIVASGITTWLIAGRLLAQSRDEVRVSHERLREALAAQERFLSSAAHELKTPIAVLLAEAQTMKTEGLPQETQQFILSVSDEMLRLGRTMESLLLLTRIRAGDAESHPARHPINELTANAIEQSRTLAAQNEVHIVAQLHDSGLDVEVCGDDALLQTMLDSLIRDAVRFSPRGGDVGVEVAVRNQRAEVIVRDKGPGISAAAAEQMFGSPHTKAAAARGRGTGLGIAIARGIAELHGGTIRFNNRDAGGCELTVSLALAS